MEEEFRGDEFRLRRVEHVEGDVEHVREKALEIAKVHEPLYRHKGQRSVFRIGADSFMTVMERADGVRPNSRFRVSVGELVPTEEYVEEAPTPEQGKGCRGIFHRKN
ncbi:hypothetical protein ACIBO9_18445 [Streptomyces prunicolor]|uniref:hypothetical protein n=1 Tax=Streptomyces prunicolor TaxID=67348 RepID=UPI0037D648BA